MLPGMIGAVVSLSGLILHPAEGWEPGCEVESWDWFVACLLRRAKGAEKASFGVCPLGFQKLVLCVLFFARAAGEPGAADPRIRSKGP